MWKTCQDLSRTQTVYRHMWQVNRCCFDERLDQGTVSGGVRYTVRTQDVSDVALCCRGPWITTTGDLKTNLMAPHTMMPGEANMTHQNIGRISSLPLVMQNLKLMSPVTVSAWHAPDDMRLRNAWSTIWWSYLGVVYQKLHDCMGALTILLVPASGHCDIWILQYNHSANP